MKLQYTKMIAATALVFASASSNAALIYTGPITDTGTGIGAVNTVLTLSKTNTGTSTGMVSYNGSSDEISGNVQPGAAHNSTWSFSQLNITDASDLSFVFNPVEPGQVDANSITLESLILTIYSDTGGIAYTTSLANPEFFATSETGTGKSGYTFGLDATSILDAQAYIIPNYRVGLAATVSSATGGPDTFYVGVGSDGEGPGNEVPEPGSLALLGLGIAGLTALRRRRV